MTVTDPWPNDREYGNVLPHPSRRKTDVDLDVLVEARRPRGLWARLREWWRPPVCRCGHDAKIHNHLRRGSDCGVRLCGCEKFIGSRERSAY